MPQSDIAVAMCRRLRVTLLVAVGLTLAACSALPTSGPTRDQVLEIEPDRNPLGVHLIQFTPDIVKEIRDHPEEPPSVIDKLKFDHPVDELGPGDALSVTIYEAGSGLFAHSQSSDENSDDQTAGSSGETLPRLEVDRKGMIMVPYAGEIEVAGKTTTAVQRIIEKKLADKAEQPQVVVSVVGNGSNIAYVSGDVRNPGRYPLSLAHEKLLDMVALAGGPTHSPQDTIVRISREGQEATTSLYRIETIPAENIPVQPLDRIQVDYLPRTYLTFGATGRVAQIQFDAATVSLAEAMARVSGLDDNRANPEAVFLFRFEDAHDSALLGLPAPGTASVAAMPGAMPRGTPVIYAINMRDPETFFTTQQFEMHDKDLLYIANAPTVQIYKFLQLIYTFATPAVSAKAASN